MPGFGWLRSQDMDRSTPYPGKGKAPQLPLFYRSANQGAILQGIEHQDWFGLQVKSHCEELVQGQIVFIAVLRNAPWLDTVFYQEHVGLNVGYRGRRCIRRQQPLPKVLVNGWPTDGCPQLFVGIFEFDTINNYFEVVCNRLFVGFNHRSRCVWPYLRDEGTDFPPPFICYHENEFGSCYYPTPLTPTFVGFTVKDQKAMGKKSKSKKQNMEDRFAAAETRPQFRSLKATESKVVLDERFSSVLTDPRFQLEGKDKYGRGKKKQAVKEELSAFYTIQEKDDANQPLETDTNEGSTDHSPVNNDDADDPKVVEDPASRIAYLTAFSRGEIEVSSSSEDDESSRSSDDDDNDEDDNGENRIHGRAGVLDPSTKDEEVEITYDDSPYLVATNLDWENMRAVDILAIVSSFAPPGAVKKVLVYQSDFGIERMAKDKIVGPTEIWKRKKVKKQQTSNDSDEEGGSTVEGEDDDNSVGSSEQGSSEKESDDYEDDNPALDPEESNVYDESDFDPEKLRAYEASKLKYYFAIIEFAKPEYADVAYKEVDGMEFEHSSSAIDLRALPPEALDDVVKDRPMRDEATSVPSNYDPPDFIVGALQQTKVDCTWDQGDVERERKLTKYGTGEWQNLSEADELKAYLASDASTDDESDDEKEAKGSNLRKLLGLDSGDESEKSPHSRGDSSNDESDSDEEGEKTLKFVPETKDLEQKIRNKLESTEDTTTELTPWQKYQEKRKQKRKERRQAAKTRGATAGGNKANQTHNGDDDSDDEDDFLMGSEKPPKRKSEEEEKTTSAKSSNYELELLLAGEDEVEEARDYDIRGIQRMEKNKDKRLRGTRKRKEDKIAEDVSGKDFKVNIADERFASVLDGSDDRFGIDKTDPNYKDTSGMREILSEQTKRRKKKRKTLQKGDSFEAVPDVRIEENAKSAGASALSALVQKIKTQVSAR